MRKILTVLICAIVLIVLIVFKLSNTDLEFNITSVKNNDTKQLDSVEINLDVYTQLLFDILSESDTSKLSGHELLTDTVLDSLDILYSNNKEIDSLNESTSNDGQYNDVLELENTESNQEKLYNTDRQDNEKFPVIDLYAKVYKYGTKDESDTSYKLYNEQPIYEVLNTEICNNTIKIKIFNRDIRGVQQYNFTIQKDGKIKEFMQVV